MSNTPNSQNCDEAKKAEKLMDKDVPNSEEAPQKGSQTQKPQPYRPDENVDDQEHQSSTPAHNTSMKQTPFSGAQVVKEKKSHKDNIDEKSDEADPKGSE
ncbi:hypothetical protein [Vreelandella sp. EE22]